MRNLRDESGNILIMTALSLTMLLSVSAIAVDAGNLYYSQRQLQTLADSAAIAAALEIGACGGLGSTSSSCSYMQTAATKAFTENGSAAPTISTQQCSGVSAASLTLAINNGPCALGSTASDPNYGLKNYVEVIVANNQPTFFAHIFGISTANISARAEAGYAIPSGSGSGMDVLGTTGQTLTLNSGANVSQSTGGNCSVNVNSSGTPAVMEDSGAKVNVSGYNVHGNVTNNGGSYTPAPTTGAATVTDPYSSLTAPSQPANTSSPSTVSSATTLQPGTYPSGINFNGSGYTVTLSPGVYYMNGNINVGGITINGTGVTIYMASGQLNMNSASTVNLTAPTATQASGDGCASCSGMLIWQPSSNTDAMNLDSASNSNWNGAVYTPGAQLTLNGGSYVTDYGGVAAKSVMLNSAIDLGDCNSASNGSVNISLAE